MAPLIVLISLCVVTFLACSLDLDSAGNNMLAKIPMIAMTTNSSIRVKPCREKFLVVCLDSFIVFILKRLNVLQIPSAEDVYADFLDN